MSNHPLSFLFLFLTVTLTITNAIELTTFPKVAPLYLLCAVPFAYLLELLIAGLYKRKERTLGEMIQAKRAYQLELQQRERDYNNSWQAKYNMEYMYLVGAAIFGVLFYYTDNGWFGIICGLCLYYAIGFYMLGGSKR